MTMFHPPGQAGGCSEFTREGPGTEQSPWLNSKRSLCWGLAKESGAQKTPQSTTRTPPKTAPQKPTLGHKANKTY